MPSYFVKDVMHFYPRLQDVARLYPDAGDARMDRPPYKITPYDFSVRSTKCGAGGICEPIEADGSELSAFEMVELYRQLCHFDKADGNFDGQIGIQMSEKKVTIPVVAKGHHYWGAEWTPMSRLATFVMTHLGKYTEMLSSVDRDFPNAKSFTLGNIDSGRSKSRPLCDDELRYIQDLSLNLSGIENGNYASLLDEALLRTDVLEVFIPGELKASAAMEAKSFGYTHIFSLGGEAAIHLISYPQFGQSRFFDVRRPARLYAADGIEVLKHMPLVGEDAREDIINNYLRPFSKGEAIEDTSEERLSERWRKISHYLRRSRVYNYARYDNSVSADQFHKMLALHEALHYRNSQRSDIFRGLSSSSSLVSKIVSIGRLLTDGYERNHAIGHILVDLQAVSMEASINIWLKLDKRCREIARRNENPANDPECAELLESYRFLEQLRALGEDAEERLVEDEVYSVFFDPKALREPKWASEEDLILNPNEIELLRREETMPASDRGGG